MTLDKIVASLSEAQRAVLTHERFDPKGWEPANPKSLLLSSMVDKGLFRRANGRCMFEAFKDSFIVPTPLGLAVRDHLKGLSA